MTLDVTLEDLYRGKKVVTKIRRQIVCPICHGSGAHSSKVRGRGTERNGGGEGEMRGEEREGRRDRREKHRCFV